MSTPLPDKPRAIIHTRVSRDAQAENTSHASQLGMALKKATELGAEVVATYQEEISGALYRARPDIQASLAKIEAGEADMLIFAKLDRAGRDVDALRDVKRRIERAGGQMVFADGMHFEDNPSGNFLFTVLGAAAENERAMIRERMMSGLRARAKSGIQVARTKVAYGLRVVQKDDVTRNEFPPDMEGKYLVIEDKAEIVRRYIFEAKALRNDSLRSIQKALHSAGIPSPSGRKLWGITTIRCIIENEIYKGVASYGKSHSYVDESRIEKGLRPRVQVERTKGEIIRIEVPPIVSSEIWEKANKNLHESREKHSGRKDRRYMMSGLLRCPKCGAKMVTRARVRPSGDPNEPARIQYTCRFKLPNNVYQCDAPAVNNIPMERALVMGLVSLIEEPEAINKARNVFRQSQAQARAKHNGNEAARLKAIRDELDKLDRREAVAAESKLEAKLNGASVTVWDDMLARIHRQRTVLESEYNGLKSAHRSEKAAPSSIEALLKTNTPEEIEGLIAALRDENPKRGASRHRIVSQLVEKIVPIGRYRSLGVRATLISPPGFEIVLTVQNGKTELEMHEKQE